MIHRFFCCIETSSKIGEHHSLAPPLYSKTTIRRIKPHKSQDLTTLQTRRAGMVFENVLPTQSNRLYSPYGPSCPPPSLLPSSLVPAGDQALRQPASQTKTSTVYPVHVNEIKTVAKINCNDLNHTLQKSAYWLKIKQLGKNFLPN